MRLKPTTALIFAGVCLPFIATLGAGRSEPPAQHDHDCTVHAPVVDLAIANTSRGSGLSLLVEGDRALESGDHGAAESAYRSAWRDPAVREQAARALHGLYRAPEISPRVDEEAVRATLRQLGAGFNRFETEHFVILSDCSPEWTRQRGALLERTREQFFRVADRLKLWAYPHQTKLVCVLFNDHARYRSFARRADGLESEWVAGYYATYSNRIVFYNDATSPAYADARTRLDRSIADSGRRDPGPENTVHGSTPELDQRLIEERARLDRTAAAYATAKTVHEAVHLLSFNTGVQCPTRDYPFWLSEGLATSFETTDTGPGFGPDRPQDNPRRQRFRELLAQDRLPALETLIVVTDAPNWDAATAETMYGLSQALLLYLYRTNPDDLGRYMKALGDEPRGRLSPSRHRELFVRHFGDPSALERRLLASER